MFNIINEKIERLQRKAKKRLEKIKELNREIALLKIKIRELELGIKS